MIIVKATKESEAGVLPPEHLFAEMVGDTDTLDRFRDIGLNGEEKRP
jgi:hypothetical protein